mmetsp:Transcript_12990/g.34667  ORF Transcript_12990/g.34667 Transcript_12990/m.34667 type:complete len:253 (+) Transcript_12990:297-1055(+)
MPRTCAFVTCATGGSASDALPESSTTTIGGALSGDACAMAALRRSMSMRGRPSGPPSSVSTVPSSMRTMLGWGLPAARAAEASSPTAAAAVSSTAWCTRGACEGNHCSRSLGPKMGWQQRPSGWPSGRLDAQGPMCTPTPHWKGHGQPGDWRMPWKASGKRTIHSLRQSTWGSTPARPSSAASTARRARCTRCHSRKSRLSWMGFEKRSPSTARRAVPGPLALGRRDGTMAPMGRPVDRARSATSAARSSLS